MNIGWIGLGAIGTEMVKRLLGDGHAVTAYARGKGVEEASQAGARIVGDYRALAEGSDVLVLCVYDDPQVRAVLLDGGALAALRPGAILVSHTTGSPALVRELAAAAPAGVRVVDAAFSGGPHNVAAAELTLMIGGAQDAVDRVAPVFKSYASALHHLGGPGTGQIMKLLNNLLFATNLMNTAELLRVAEAQGFAPATVAQVIQGGSGASFAMGMFRGGAPPALLLESARPYLEKDVATALAVAREAALDLTAFQPTARYFQPGDARA